MQLAYSASVSKCTVQAAHAAPQHSFCRALRGVSVAREAFARRRPACSVSREAMAHPAPPRRSQVPVLAARPPARSPQVVKAVVAAAATLEQAPKASAYLRYQRGSPTKVRGCELAGWGPVGGSRAAANWEPRRAGGQPQGPGPVAATYLLPGPPGPPHHPPCAPPAPAPASRSTGGCSTRSVGGRTRRRS